MKPTLLFLLVVALITVSIVSFVRFKEKISHRDFSYGPYTCGKSFLSIIQHVDHNWLEGAASNQTQIKYKNFLYTTRGEFCPEGIKPDACYMKELKLPSHSLPDILSIMAESSRPSIKEVDEFASCFESIAPEFYNTQMENLKTMGIRYNFGIDSIIVLPRE